MENKMINLMMVIMNIYDFFHHILYYLDVMENILDDVQDEFDHFYLVFSY